MHRKGKPAFVAALLIAAAVTGSIYATTNGSAAQRSPAVTANHGKKEFLKAKCGACHILAAASAKGTAGPSLDGSAMKLARLKAIITKGKGAMPPFRRLGTTNIHHITVYILKVRKKPAPKPKPTPEAKTGEEAWKKGGCASCHALAAAGATAVRGPSLDAARPSVEEIIEIVTLGDEYDAMPAYRTVLTKAEIALLAEYIVRVRKP